jgi:hypothetical protein
MLPSGDSYGDFRKLTTAAADIELSFLQLTFLDQYLWVLPMDAATHRTNRFLREWPSQGVT